MNILIPGPDLQSCKYSRLAALLYVVGYLCSAAGGIGVVYGIACWAGSHKTVLLLIAAVCFLLLLVGLVSVYFAVEISGRKKREIEKKEMEDRKKKVQEMLQRNQ